MNDLLTFDFEESAVRVVTIDDAPWFVATDIAAILGYRNAPDMTRNLDQDETDTHILRSSSQNRELTIISESGLYNAIFRSRRNEARAFRCWVTGTVLPALRRTGRYDLSPAETGSGPDQADAALLNARVATVREARRLFGHGVARAVWRDLGLPLPETAMLPIEDGLAAAVTMAIEGRDRFTNDELADWLGLGRPDAKMRQRFGDILRAMGWDRRKTRFGPLETAYAWHAPEMVET